MTTDLTITTERAVELVGLPVEEWIAKCHQISCALADEVGGKVRRGYWLGTTEPGAYFHERFSQHSWIELPDGTVLDPTRHAFRPSEGALWHGPADEYDIGGCRSEGPRPPFQGDPYGDILLDLDPDSVAVSYIAGLLGIHESEIEMGLSHEAMFYLGNLPIKDKEGPGVIGEFYVREVYEAIDRAGYRAVVPIDRWDWMMT